LITGDLFCDGLCDHALLRIWTWKAGLTPTRAFAGRAAVAVP
jgi:hypothetical protein